MDATNLSLPIGDETLPPLSPLSPPIGVPPPRGLPPLPTMEMVAYLDKSFFDIFELVVNGVVINALSLIGSAGNILCIYVLYLHGFKNSTNIILVSLAIADLSILLTMPLRKISILIEPFDKALSITVESFVVCYQYLTLNRVWSLTSNAHIALIAVERFLAVYFPFQVSRWSTPTRITAIVAILHVSFYLLLTPMFTMFKLIWVLDPNLNETIAIPAITDFYMAREKQFNFYNSYVVNLLLGALFLATTLLCCIGICVKLLTMSKKRKKLMTRPTALTTLSSGISNVSTLKTTESLSSNLGQEESRSSLYVTTEVDDERKYVKSQQQKPHTKAATPIGIDVKVVKLLLIVCFVYLVLIFPSFLLFVFQEVYVELREPYWRRVNFLATTVSMFLMALNSSLNFFIYVANSNKFYGTVKRVMSCTKDTK